MKIIIKNINNKILLFVLFTSIFVSPFSYAQFSQNEVPYTTALPFINNDTFGSFINNDTFESFQNNDEQLIPKIQSERTTSDENLKKPKISPIEKNYNQRLGINDNNDLRMNINESLLQQGYDIFSTSDETHTYSGGAIQDSYVLGQGDEVNVILQGGKQGLKRSKIDREGLLIYDFASPIAAKGKTLGEIRTLINNIVNLSLLETTAYVTLGKVRQIVVTVTGEVNEPGQINLNGLSTIFDALRRTGGIKKSGSLRNIKVLSDAKVFDVDLYPIIFGNNSLGIKKNVLENDMVIIVPPVKNTMAIAGNSYRKGIYELSSNEKTVDDILKILGEDINFNQYSQGLQSIDNQGIDFLTGNINLQTKIKNKDILILNNKNYKKIGSVELLGSILNQSKYPIDAYPSLSSLITSPSIFEKNTYPYSFILKSKLKNTIGFKYEIKDLFSILNKESDVTLNSEDEIIFLNNKDLQYFFKPEIINIFNENGKRFSNAVNDGTCLVTKNLFLNTQLNKDINYKNAGFLKVLTAINSNGLFFNKIYKTKQLSTGESIILQTDNSTTSNNFEKNCPEIFVREPDLIKFLINNLKIVTGDTQKTGLHLISNDTSIKKFISYLDDEIVNFDFSPDKRIINVIDDKIELKGAVNFPTKIKFTNNLKLSSLITGIEVLSKDAYPFFGIIKRKNSVSGIHEYLKFNPSSILSGKEDKKINKGDTIILFKINEINQIQDFISKEQALKNIETKNKTLKDDPIKENFIFIGKVCKTCSSFYI